MWQEIRKKIVMMTIDGYHHLLFFLKIYKKSHFKSDKPVIVFITDVMQARVPRIIKWVDRSGEYETILLYRNQEFNSVFLNDFGIEQIPFKSNYELLRILYAIENIYLLHCFAQHSTYIAFLFGKTKQKIIADYQDVVWSYYKSNAPYKWQRKDVKAEIIVLQKAHGIVSHCLEPLAFYREYKIKNRPPVLFFPLYTDSDLFVPENKIKKLSGLHLVYVGTIAGRKAADEQAGNIKFFTLANKLAQQKIHLHLYPSPYTTKETINDYEILQSQNEYFHIHRTLEQSKLGEEIAQYHFGINTYYRSFINTDQNKFNYLTSLKTFNYLEAGLPVLLSKDPKFMHWLFNRKKCVVDLEPIDLDNVRETVKKTDYSVLYRNTLKAREDFSLKNNIHKMVQFYKKVHNS